MKNIKLQIFTQDNYPLIGYLYEAPQPSALVIIAPAIGVNQSYYSAFANWLAEQGYTTLTFDYRGSGASLYGSLKGFHATIIDWAKFDCTAALEKLHSIDTNLPIYWVGHSLGGQIIPFVTNNKKIHKIITIACGSGYWRYNTAHMQPLIAWLWYVVVPMTVRIFDYFPGKKLRKVGDLPKGIILQWRSWCFNRDYAIGVEGDYAKQLYENVTQPIDSLSFTDDEYMSARSISSMHDFYSNAPKHMIRLDPKNLDIKRIGHFGFFKKEFQSSLWEKYFLPLIAS